MRHYQPKKNNPYKLPHNVYMQCLYMVRDYERQREELQKTLNEATQDDYKTSDEVMRSNAYKMRCENIEKSFMVIPVEYRRAVLDGIIHDAGYPNNASVETYRRWRRRLIHQIAVNNNLL